MRAYPLAVLAQNDISLSDMDRLVRTKRAKFAIVRGKATLTLNLEATVAQLEEERELARRYR